MSRLIETQPSQLATETPRKRPRVSQHSERSRSLAACSNCREKKVKCSGNQPCSYCTKRNLSCLFTGAEKKKLYTVSEIENLQHKVALFEEQQQDHIPSFEILREASSQLDQNAVKSRRIAHTLQHPSLVSSTPEGLHNSVPKTPSGIATSSALSSSDNFGLEVRTLLDSRSHHGSGQSPSVNSILNASQRDYQALKSIRHWPTAEEAHSLLETVILHVGISQQLFDARTFSDSLSLLYSDTDSQVSRFCIVEILLVFAIGRLLQAKREDIIDLPTTPLFREALVRMPNLDDIRGQGMIGIEIMGLAALYYQIIDQKDDAYIHISIALRLAIMQGWHRVETAHKLKRSEVIHGNRLWWSIFMQERRLAAAGGYPAALSETAISNRLPSEFPGFPSVVALAVNVKIAKILGEVTSVVYSQNSISEGAFISSVQGILSSLSEAENTMPKEYWMEFNQTGLSISGRPFAESSNQVARTASSLYLSIYSTIIYTTRPVLLHMAKVALDGSNENPPDNTPISTRLANVCIGAAQKSLVILSHLRGREILAKHAFLDLDALFSVGFIFILAEVIHPRKGLGVSGIETCCAILQYLINFGNSAASKRLTQINSMLSSLPTPLQSTDLTSRIHNAVRGGSSIAEAEVPNQVNSSSGSNIPGVSDIPSTNPIGPLTVDGTILFASDSQDDFTRIMNDFESIQGQLLDTTEISELTMEGDNDLFSVYRASSFPLTGVDWEDWRTFESQFS